MSGVAADTATLEGVGTYHLSVWWVQQNRPVAELLLLVNYAPGTSTQAITPYCTFQDMLDVAGWLTQLRGGRGDQEGFYSQRLQARTWFDWCVINNYRGARLVL